MCRVFGLRPHPHKFYKPTLGPKYVSNRPCLVHDGRYIYISTELLCRTWKMSLSTCFIELMFMYWPHSRASNHTRTGGHKEIIKKTERRSHWCLEESEAIRRFPSRGHNLCGWSREAEQGYHCWILTRDVRDNRPECFWQTKELSLFWLKNWRKMATRI